MFRLFLPAATLLVLAPWAWAGTHIGNIVLKVKDDDAPAVVLDPADPPQLALWDCLDNPPLILTGSVGSNGVVTFGLTDDIDDVCKVGLDLGSPVDVNVGAFTVTTVSPVANTFDLDPTPVEDLVGGTIRVGTTTMMSNVRAFAAVPRTATSAEASAIEAALSVVTYTAP